jgi:hypothetical protein
VYLPSPLSTYRLFSPEVSVSRPYGDRPTRHFKERVAEYSDLMCDMIRAATIDQGAGFLDMRQPCAPPVLNTSFMGPLDFRHFNRKGMENLGQAVAQRIDSPLMQDSCAQGAITNARQVPRP